MRVVVLNHLTLDGVLQGPGRSEEDTRGGFRHGGWAIPGGDEVMNRKFGQWLGRSDGGLLLGRRSYEEMLGFWNAEGGPFKDALNRAPKYVPSTDPTTELKWPNSTVLHGDIRAAIGDLKRTQSGDLVIMGSGQLIRSLLIPHGLIDEYVLCIHPITLGSGQRLFDDTVPPVKLRLVESEATTTGVIIATYQPAGQA